MPGPGNHLPAITGPPRDEGGVPLPGLGNHLPAITVPPPPPPGDKGGAPLPGHLLAITRPSQHSFTSS
jgi:hypothetical protein